MLQKQTVAMPFIQGLDQKSDSKQVSPGEVLTLENVQWQTPKKFRKRYGFTKDAATITVPSAPSSFSNLGGGSMANGVFVENYNGEKVLSDGQNLYSWSPASSTWLYRGRSQLCSVSSSQIQGSNQTALGQDSAYNSTLGLYVYAWESFGSDPRLAAGTAATNGVCITVVDATTGAQILSNYGGASSQFGTSTAAPKCVSVGGNLYVLYLDQIANTLRYQQITSSGLGSTGVLINNPNMSSIGYDVCVVGSTLYVGYYSSTPNITITSFNASLVQQATISKTETATNGIGLFSDGSNNIWCAYGTGSAVKAFIVNSALVTTVLIPTVVDASVSSGKNVTGIYDGAKGIIFYDIPGSPISGQQVGADTSLGAFTVAANYTQPAVNAQVTITLNQAGFPAVGQNINIATGGTYYVNVASGSTITVTNLGYGGNAAPGTVIANPQNIYATGGFQNAITKYNTLTVGGAVGTVATFCRSVFLSSKAFLQNGFAHVVVGRDSVLQSMYFLCSLFNVTSSIPAAHVVAKISQQNQGGGLPFRSLLAGVNSITANNYQVSLLDHTLSIASTASAASGAPLVVYYNGVVSISMNMAPSQVSTQFSGNTLLIGGGCIKMYDGATPAEHGFHYYPEGVSYSVAGTGGNMTGGLFGYAVVYSWTDNKGQVHRSAPAFFSVTQKAVPNVGAVTLTIPTLRVTEKQNVQIELYRTYANGSVYYRIDTLLSGYPYMNSTTADSVSITENLADTFNNSSQIYTTGEVSNSAIPAVSAMAASRSRVAAILAENPYQWAFSKQVIPGNPVDFSLAFVKNIEAAGGAMTAIGMMDDKIILFKANSIYYVVGSGPASSGANDDFTDPFKIPSDVGCVDPASVVEWPGGLMFKSNKGIYNLGRDLQVSYIGAGVESYNSNHVQTAKLIQNANQVRFCLDNGVAAVYDYFVGKWGTYTNIAAVSSCIWNGQFTYLQSGGGVFNESQSVFTDNGTFYAMKVGSSWLQFAGLQGFQRVYDMLILGDYIGTHNLVVTIYKNFNSTSIQTTTIPGALVDGVYQWRVPMAQQKCEALQFVIQDSQSSAYNEGLSLSGISFEVGVKKGTFKLGATHTYG